MSYAQKSCKAQEAEPSGSRTRQGAHCIRHASVLMPIHLSRLDSLAMTKAVNLQGTCSGLSSARHLQLLHTLRIGAGVRAGDAKFWGGRQRAQVCSAAEAIFQTGQAVQES